MVCSKCQRLTASTQLATPGVKRRNELYYGSSASASSKSADKSKPSATLGNNGIGKSKLLSQAAKNPYAAYASTCSTCKKKVEQGRKYCHSCAYKANACAVCGKNEKTNKAKAGAGPMVEGQRFSAK